MNIFTHIKSKLSILDVINSYTTLKKAGLYWKGHCPFHGEKTASFTVSPHKEIFYCFGCHAGGDLIEFIAQIENCSQMEAVKFLADRYNIQLPEQTFQPTSTEKKKRHFEICTLVANWCHKKLINSPHTLAYLNARSITTEEILYFNLGYLPGGPQALNVFIKQMAEHAILVDDLIQCNIIIQGNRTLYSPFEERIIFPIQDTIGRCCGFGGRIFKENDDRPKYYNSKENEFFAKGSLLFGLDLAKKVIQQKDTAFLVEGYTDCIAMKKHGFANTVATLGTACTEEHLKLLSRYTQELVVLFDGDDAGQQALVRLATLCWNATLDLKIISLPKNEDPASFLQKGGDLSSMLKQAQDIFAFFIATQTKDFVSKPLMTKIKEAQKIITILHKIEDPLKRNILLQRASDSMNIPLNALLPTTTHSGQLIGKTPAQSPVQNQNDQTVHATNETGTKTTLVNTIFYAIMNNISLFSKNNVRYILNLFPHPMQKILLVLDGIIEKTGSNVTFLHFMEHLDLTDKNYISKILLNVNQELDEGVLENLIVQLQKKHWKDVVHLIKSQIEQAKQENDQEKITALLQDFLILKKKIVGKNLI